MPAVRLRGIPTDLYRQLQEHSDEVRRELKLLADSEHQTAVPARLLDVLEKLEPRFTAVMPLRNAVLEARRRGEALADVELELTEDDVRVLRYLHELLNEVEDYCRSGHLLAVDLSAEARDVRRWIVEEAERQVLAEAAPRAWHEQRADGQ